MSKLHYTQDGADDEPAFPVTSAAEHQFCGMSLRDAFAMKALPVVCAEYMDSARSDGFEPDWRMGVALDAYAMADAMLAARAAIAQAGSDGNG